MVMKWRKNEFLLLEKKNTYNLSISTCVLLHFHPIQSQVKSRINKNKPTLFPWISSTCIGEYALVLSKTY